MREHQTGIGTREATVIGSLASSESKPNKEKTFFLGICDLVLELSLLAVPDAQAAARADNLYGSSVRITATDYAGTSIGILLLLALLLCLIFLPTRKAEGILPGKERKVTLSTSLEIPRYRTTLFMRLPL